MSPAFSRPLFKQLQTGSPHFRAAGRRFDTVSYVKTTLRSGEHAHTNTVPNPGMGSRNYARKSPSASPSLDGLAEQLRDGPLQRLVELQTETTALADRLGDGGPARIEDVEKLVKLSMSAMDHFNAFTRELAAALRELTDAEQRNEH